MKKVKGNAKAKLLLATLRHASLVEYVKPCSGTMAFALETLAELNQLRETPHGYAITDGGRAVVREEGAYEKDARRAAQVKQG